MILADTSVWIDHLRSGEPALEERLEQGLILIHPFIIGEIAIGNLRQREEILSTLGGLPRANVASDTEVLHLIEQERLYGRGLGYVDAHLIASVRLTPGATLWTRDQALHSVAQGLDLAEEQ